MTEPDLKIGPAPEGHVWRATPVLRFVERPAEETDCMASPARRVLQQRWQNLTTGEWEWRDVPLEAE